MKHLRDVSARPELLVDQNGARLVDPPIGVFGGTTVGRQGPLSRGRIVQALTPNRGSGIVELAPRVVLCDHNGALLIDPATGDLVGESNGLRAHRWLAAGKTIDTRRL